MLKRSRFGKIIQKILSTADGCDTEIRKSICDIQRLQLEYAMKFEEYYEKFEKMQRWIKEDLKRSSVLAKANFLVAMGIFNYIEILGGFYASDTESRPRFKSVFEDLLPKEYKNLYDEIDKLTTSVYKNKNGVIKYKGGAYDCLRCGLTHEYLVKTYTIKNSKIELDFAIYGVDDAIDYMTNIISNKCGIELVLLQKDKYKLKIYNPRLIYDLNEAFNNYKKKMLKNKSIKNQFIKRCEDIHLEKFE